MLLLSATITNCAKHLKQRNLSLALTSKILGNLNCSSSAFVKTNIKHKTFIHKKFYDFGTMGVRKMATTLYMNDQSPPARAVMMTIDILGVKDLNMEDMNPVSREQDEPEFVKMNPMRTIPILDEGDFSLGDSHAIMMYLFEKHSKPEHQHLYPKDLRKRAVIHHRFFFECGILFPRLRAIMAPTYFGRISELSKNMRLNLDDAYQMMEDFLSQGTYMAGEELTLADFSIYTTTQSVHTLHPVDDNRFPKLCQWIKTMSELDVVKRVNEPGGSMHGKLLLVLMERNKERLLKKSKI